MSEMHKRPLFYILDGKIPKPASLKEWTEHFQNPGKRFICYDVLAGGVTVSTIFKGLVSNAKGPPDVFETRILGGEHDNYINRYCTYEEAEQGHEDAVNMVLNKSS